MPLGARVLRFQRRNLLLRFLAAVLLMFAMNRYAAWMKERHRPAHMREAGEPNLSL
jgi:hypothetical protein